MLQCDRSSHMEMMLSLYRIILYYLMMSSPSHTGALMKVRNHPDLILIEDISTV